MRRRLSRLAAAATAAAALLPGLAHAQGALQMSRQSQWIAEKLNLLQTMLAADQQSTAWTRSSIDQLADLQMNQAASDVIQQYVQQNAKLDQQNAWIEEKLAFLDKTLNANDPNARAVQFFKDALAQVPTTPDDPNARGVQFLKDALAQLPTTADGGLTPQQQAFAQDVMQRISDMQQKDAIDATIRQMAQEGQTSVDQQGWFQDRLDLIQQMQTPAPVDPNDAAVLWFKRALEQIPTSNGPSATQQQQTWFGSQLDDLKQTPAPLDPNDPAAKFAQHMVDMIRTRNQADGVQTPQGGLLDELEQGVADAAGTEAAAQAAIRAAELEGAPSSVGAIGGLGLMPGLDNQGDASGLAASLAYLKAMLADANAYADTSIMSSNTMTEVAMLLPIYKDFKLREDELRWTSPDLYQPGASEVWETPWSLDMDLTSLCGR